MKFATLSDLCVKVSPCGHVISTITNKPLKHIPDRHGYPRVYCKDIEGRRRGHFVHRLVAIGFIQVKLNSPYINHKDGDKTNYHVSNLEWCTAKENTFHAFNLGLMDSSLKKRTKVLRNQAMKDLKSLGYTHDTIAFVFGCSQVNVSRVLNNMN